MNINIPLRFLYTNGICLCEQSHGKRTDDNSDDSGRTSFGSSAKEWLGSACDLRHAGRAGADGDPSNGGICSRRVCRRGLSWSWRPGLESG